MSLGTFGQMFWSNHDHVTNFSKTDYYVRLSLSLFFFTANVLEILIRGSHRVTQSRLYREREYDGKTAAS